MRAIAGLLGLALLTAAPASYSQEPIHLSEPVQQPAEPYLPLPQTPAPMLHPAAIVTGPEMPGTELMPSSPCVCEEWPGGSGFSSKDWFCDEWWCQSWYVRVEATFLQRTRGAGDRVIVETDAGAPVLSVSDFSFKLEPGVAAMLGHRLDSVSALEMQYFGANVWDVLRPVASLNNLDLPDPIGTVANDFNNANLMRVGYRSQLQNAEVNYLRDHGGATWLIGFRYLNWGDTLLINSTDNDGDVSNYLIENSNSLLGAQIGTRIVRRGFRWDWELTGKAGFFGNNIGQRQRLTDDDGTITLRNAAALDTSASFVGDINLSAHCRLSDVWRLRAGYNVIVVTGLALAPDQLDFSNNLHSGTTVDNGATVFLHGLNVGLEAIW